jgi:hypothetical protein
MDVLEPPEAWHALHMSDRVEPGRHDVARVLAPDERRAARLVKVAGGVGRLE